MLRHLLNPNKCVKLEDLSHTVELWEEQLRLYEQRKRSDGTRHTLDEEIKISVLEHICPGELERHLQLNRARYVPIKMFEMKFPFTLRQDWVPS